MLSSYEFLASYLRARFGDNERGTSRVECALLVVLIAVLCIVAITSLGESASDKFQEVGDSIAQ
jgi:Flp pilus assembly pilin Flp